MYRLQQTGIPRGSGICLPEGVEAIENSLCVQRDWSYSTQTRQDGERAAVAKAKEEAKVAKAAAKPAVAKAKEGAKAAKGSSKDSKDGDGGAWWGSDSGASDSDHDSNHHHFHHRLSTTPRLSRQIDALGTDRRASDLESDGLIHSIYGFISLLWNYTCSNRNLSRI